MYRPPARTAPLAALLLLTALLPLAVSPPALASNPPPGPTVLYDGSGSPGAQGFLYLAQPVPGAASQVGANLTTTAQITDAAGFFGRPGVVPMLDRAAGFTLRFTVRVNAEAHAGSDKDGDGTDDRAGLSVIVLSSDALGIELGFWQDRIWAQEDGAAVPPAGTLFTQAEGAAWDTTAMTTYELAVQGDRYTLRAGPTAVLAGELRDYRAFDGSPDPYGTPNFLFFGDNTTSASANVDFGGPIVILSGPQASDPPPIYLPMAQS